MIAIKRLVQIFDIQKPLLIAALIPYSLGLTSCGKGGLGAFVKNVEFSQEQQADRTVGTLKVTLSKSVGTLPITNLPLENPAAIGSTRGHITIAPQAGGGSALVLQFDLAQVDQFQKYSVGAVSPTLPNGSPIPVALSQDVFPVSVTFGENSRVYFALGSAQAMAGVALALKQFDALGTITGGADLFLPFWLTNGMRGVAGIFTSPVSGRSGIALLWDLGSATVRQTF